MVMRFLRMVTEMASKSHLTVTTSLARGVERGRPDVG